MLEAVRTAQHSIEQSHRRPSNPGLLALVAIIATGCVRLAYLLSNADRFNGDEAISGIVAAQIRRGHFYTFFPGQSYGGVFEEYLQAAMYFVLPLPQNPLTLRFTELAMSMMTAALIYLVGRSILPSAWHAAIAASFFALGPWYNVQGGAMAMSFYDLGALLAIGGFYFAVRINIAPERYRWQLLLGLALGLAYWNALIAGYLLIPVAVWLAPTLLRSLKSVASVAGGAVIGGLPALVWSIRTHNLVPLPPSSGSTIGIVERVGNLFGPVLRQFLGFGRVGSGDRPGRIGELVWPIEAALAIGYCIAVWRRRRSLGALLRFRREGREPGDILLLAPPIIVIIYCSSSSAAWITDPKYLFSVYPLLALGVAAMLPQRVNSRLVVASVLVGVLIAVPCVQFFKHAALQVAGPAGAGGPSTVLDGHERDRQLLRIATDLKAENETYVFSTYWTGMPLSYLAGPKLNVEVIYAIERFPDAIARAAGTANPVYVLNPAITWDQWIINILTASHLPYRERHYGSLVVFDHLGPGGLPQQLKLPIVTPQNLGK